MAQFAKMNGAQVIEVIVVNNNDLDNLAFPESEPVGIAYLQSIFGVDTKWLQTSYNASFRKNYAGTGYTYDSVLDAFIAPKPYLSWTLDTNSCQWVSPIPYPDTPGVYMWNEETQTWIER
jgi:hypothetical protein